MPSDHAIRTRLEQLESEARSTPGKYAHRLWLLTAVGYAYPMSILLGSMGLLAGLVIAAPSVFSSGVDGAVIVYILLVGGALGLVSVVARAFLVRIPDPEGLEVTRTDAPELWRMVDEVAGAIGVKRVDRILLDEQMNASAVQRSTRIIGGRRINMVIIGLPMMMVMSPEELRFVLGHEMAHLHGVHGGLGARMYRLHQTWQTLAVPFTRKGWLRWLALGWFVSWYGKQVAVVTLPQRRLHEYAADRRGAGVLADAKVSADALLVMDWNSYRVGQTFWPDLGRSVPDQPLPPPDVLANMQGFVQSAPNVAQLQRWTARERRCKTPIASEHPCLRDRLAALGHSPGALENYRPIPSADGSLGLLGPFRARAWKTVNIMWKAKAIDNWRTRHQRIVEAQKSPKPQSAPAPAGAEPHEWEVRTKWDATMPQLDRQSTEEAIESVRQFIDKHPEFGTAEFVIGRLLLRQDDEAGVEHVERAMKLDSDLIGPGLVLLLEHYRDEGRDDDAEPIRRRLEAHQEDTARANKERKVLRRGDQFEPHGMHPGELQLFRRMLYRYPQVRAAWLVRKRVRLFSDLPSYVLAVDRIAGLLDDRRRSDRNLVNGLTSQIPHSCVTVIWPRLSRRMRRRILAACNEPMFVAEAYLANEVLR